MVHQPVMVDEVLLYLGQVEQGIIIDGTLGLGGHSEAILKHTPDTVTVVGIDRDAKAIEFAIDRLSGFGSRFLPIQGSYADFPSWQKSLPQEPILGFLLDLGLSSAQLESAGRGFSFRDIASLDMRFDTSLPIPTAEDLVNNLPEQELADLIFRYGEEKASRRIARAILHERSRSRIDSAQFLADLIGRQVKGSTRLHPATRTFQALRIAVNRELDHLQNGLRHGCSFLHPTGRMVIISYHSLEDRIVKQFFLNHSGKCTCPSHIPVCICNKTRNLQILTRKPVVPTPEETDENPRARSAKLRVAERVREKEL